MITVTMPISQYEHMKEEIETLNNQSIYKYVNRNYSDMERNEYEITLDVSSMMKEILGKEYNHVTIKTI